VSAAKCPASFEKSRFESVASSADVAMCVCVCVCVCVSETNGISEFQISEFVSTSEFMTISEWVPISEFVASGIVSSDFPKVVSSATVRAGKLS